MRVPIRRKSDGKIKFVDVRSAPRWLAKGWERDADKAAAKATDNKEK